MAEKAALVVDVHVVRDRAHLGDQRRADRERDMEVMSTVNAVCSLDPVELPGEAHVRARGPVVIRPELDRLVAVPVPGPDYRPACGDAERLLDAGTVRDRLAEGQDDWHAHAIFLMIANLDRGPEGPARCQRAEGTCRELIAACSDDPRHDPVDR